MRHLQQAFSAISLLREVDEIGIEIFVLKEMLDLCDASFANIYYTMCRAVVDRTKYHGKSFGSKFDAIENSNFETVIFLDTDTMVLKPLSNVLKTDEYREKEAWLFPDYWSYACDLMELRRTPRDWPYVTSGHLFGQSIHKKLRLDVDKHTCGFQNYPI